MGEPSAGKGREIEEAVPCLLIQECKISIPGEDDQIVTQQYFGGPQIHRVPRHLLRKEQKEDIYAPRMVSFGPYHHGSPHLRATEDFKPEIVSILVSESGLTREAFYSRIFQVIDQVRSCYSDQDTTNKYNNEQLAEMMFLDACLAIYLVQLRLERDDKRLKPFVQQFGLTGWFALTDMFLLENQIPFGVLKLLIDLIYTNNKEEGSKLLYKFTCAIRFGESHPQQPIREFKTQPFHFLDSLYQLCIEKEDGDAGENINQILSEHRSEGPFESLNHQFRSVTELKAKGISFKPSSYCLMDIKFNSSLWSGELQLPVGFLDEFSPQLLANITAYEASRSSNLRTPMMTFISFLKSLIVKPEDAKELREKKILFSTLNSDEEVVQVIKDIDNWGSVDCLFKQVKREIEEHCNSKRKTRIAELIHTYFRSPWSVIALLATTFLLCLTVIQTFYARIQRIRPTMHLRLLHLPLKTVQFHTFACSSVCG